jgi:hypothetical protein
MSDDVPSRQMRLVTILLLDLDRKLLFLVSVKISRVSSTL